MHKVLIVDDQALVRKGLERILSQESDMQAVGDCCDGDEVMDAVIEHRPDIVLMDVRMKRVDGIAATKSIQTLDSKPAVIMLTTFGDDVVLWGALSAGAAGFVLKDASPDDLLRAIRVASAGGAWLDPSVTKGVIRHYREQAQDHAVKSDKIMQLTVREKEVLVRVARGLTNKEIASALFVSEATVKTHISHIFSKLDARDRAAAIVYAYNAGIVLPGEA